MSMRIQRGMTLAEIMIALVLGLMLLLGLATLFSQTRQSFNQDEQIATMQAGLRFAMETIVRDVTMAGFWGGLLSPVGVTIDPDIAIGTDCGTDWVLTLTPPLSGLNNATAAQATAGFPCISSTEFRPGTDVIAVKRVVGHAIQNDPGDPGDCEWPFNEADSLQDGVIYFADNGVAGEVFVGEGPSDVAGCVENRQLAPVIYYIRNHSVTSGDGIPTLCRKILVGNSMTTECLVDGIEQLQIEYGIDTNGNGVANRYVSAPTVQQFDRVASVRIHLLARSLRADPFYTNPKTYVLGDLEDFEPQDNFYRRAATTTIVLRNPNHLRNLGN